MFERYHEKSRRAIFFARFEASQWGDAFINPNHLLLALAREDRALLTRLKVPVDDIATTLGLRKPEAMSATAHGDLPLDQDARQILVFAVEEAEQSGQQLIAPIHLLRGLLRQPCQASTFLKKFVDLETLRGLTMPEPPAVAPLMNQNIVADLREQFRALTIGLRPEMEPAVTYKLERPQ